ncbi:Snf6p [Lachancea thermotolerans CBS 6340]|uniref:KLTH0E06072p n=1 Tax=Lachancea thermotolerans (strain ATCC 56472 / CBS 6340 / NRRL Y-8284) TaxID=559295 RepID=C5DHP8_LACTC|nr:KLTH0E06072p [Lachancea thermotolerans CBS 6340]CAR23309.1 KLTH0E06072p [Lachancea thermotolerans CBS 6340]
MPPRKRRTHNLKGLRGSQDQQQSHSSYFATRLKPEQVGALVHDESDTISYRAYLVQNFIRSSEMMDALMTQNVPLPKIKAPPIFRNPNVEEMKRAVVSEREQLDAIESHLQSYAIDLPDGYHQLKELSMQIDLSQDVSDNSIQAAESAYKAQTGKYTQDDRIVVHKDRFPQLRGDHSKAPPDYWERRLDILASQQQEALRLKIMQEEEEELKRRTEEENRLRQKQEEQRLYEDPFQQQATHAQPMAGPVTANPGIPDPQPAQQPSDQPPHAMLGSIFGDMNGENFNNGFEDDEFADLDTAFF